MSVRVQDLLQALLAENQSAAAQLDEAELSAMVSVLIAARRVFVTGQGRSGLVMRMFAMRLMHLGLQSYVIGETATPPAQAGDVLMIASASGETTVTCALAEKALGFGLTLMAFTTAPRSRLGKVTQHLVVIPAPAKGHETGAVDNTDVASIQLMGALFEQQVHVVCDALCLAIARLADIQTARLWERHANLE